MGWRYLLFTLGGITLLLWSIRFFVFKLLESPRFLVGIGKDAEAVEVIKRLAEFNGRETRLSLEQLREVDNEAEKGQADSTEIGTSEKGSEEEDQVISAKRTKVLSESSYLAWKHVKALFRTRKMAFSTSLLIFIWGIFFLVVDSSLTCVSGIIGLASTLYNSFLPFLLETRGNAFGDGSLHITYRNVGFIDYILILTVHRATQTFILSVIGVPGALLAGWMVELPYLGRKGTLAISTSTCGLPPSHFSLMLFRGMRINRRLAVD